MATSFGQDIKNATRLTALQLDVLDNVYSMDDDEAKATVANRGRYARTLNSLIKRGYIDDNGVTPTGRDALYAHN